MIVKISRNRLFINQNGFRRSVIKENKEQGRCNHCGGLVRMDGELESCIMCSREKDHFCVSCSYKLHIKEDEKKISA